MDERRSNDLILSQDTYAFIQDYASGVVEVAVGPYKTGIQDTDKMVVYNIQTGTFVDASKSDAIKPCVRADEGQYLILTNPAVNNAHPGAKSKTSSALQIGKKINIPGPEIFPLYPGQTAKVVQGHQLKSNQYLLVRVYNAEEALANISKSIIVTTEEDKSKKQKDYTLSIFDKNNLITGKLLVVKGSDVSFFIPPTGIEVIVNPSTMDYVRDAVTLERLEYCILLDENGEKDYTQGPKVVFPNPTQVFIEKNGVKKFRAVELNDNMGLYVKVIAKYEDEGKQYEAGDEIFITGKTTKIYYPRPEHQLITYEGQSPIHYATTIPAGEGRYLLNKDTGEISLIKGPKMLLPNPSKEVLVRRVLNANTVKLWYPGNSEALTINENLSDINDSLLNSGRGFVTNDELLNSKIDSQYNRSSASAFGNAGIQGMSGSAGLPHYKNATRSYLNADDLTESIHRKTTYTKPREIVLDTKYAGAVMMNIWPGYAIQIVSKTGDRRVEVGPKVVLLAYDETLEILELSTGKPKTDHSLLKTVYLKINHNIVSDLITVTTSDFVDVNVRLSYRVNFDEKYQKSWFSESDYVKLLTQHMRSLIRNAVKKIDIEKFNVESTDMIRDLILGEAKDGAKRKGRLFEENGMTIYDVEVLDVIINDNEIDNLLKGSQRLTIKQNLSLLNEKKLFESFEATQKLKGSKQDLLHSESVKLLQNEKSLNEETLNVQKTLSAVRKEEEALEDMSHQSKLTRKVNKYKAKEEHIKNVSFVENTAVTERMKAITPKLIEALDSLATVTSTEILSKNLKEYQAAGLLNGESGGFENLLKTVKGTPLEKKLKVLVERIDKREDKN